MNYYLLNTESNAGHVTGAMQVFVTVTGSNSKFSGPTGSRELTVTQALSNLNLVTVPGKQEQFITSFI